MRREAALFVALGIAAASAATTDPAWGGGDDARRSFTSARPAPTSAAENARCTGCHADIAEEWASSLHRSAFRDASFLRGYALERLAFCRSCHAPEADPSAEPDAWSADHGVACTTCHGATPDEAHDATPAKRTALGEGVCVTCHEFGFPERDDDLRAPAHAAPARMMQRTAAEHAASEHAAESCASCHLPKVGEGKARHASHRFDVTRNEAFLRDALTARARREPGRVVLDLAPRGVGHAFPTGDMFRRLRVVVEVGAPGEAPVARYERRLARTFGMVGGKKTELEDTRLFGPTSLAFALPAGAETQPIRWRVTYQRLVNVPDGRNRSGAERIEDEKTLADGRLP